MIQRRYGESCNSRAYIQTPLADYINKRFEPGSRVRLAVIPFSVPANLAAQSDEQPGLGIDLAQRVQSELLQTGVIPIVELLNREDWPGKKDEFAHGNFGAIQTARDAGYDLVLVGSISPMSSMDVLAAQTKVIEVEGGVTAWYGETTVSSNRSYFNSIGADWGMAHKRPDKIYIEESVDRLARCIKDDVVADRVVPE